MNIDYKKAVDLCDKGDGALETGDLNVFFDDKHFAGNEQYRSMVLEFLMHEVQIEDNPTTVLTKINITPAYMFYNFKELPLTIKLSTPKSIGDSCFQGSNVNRISAKNLDSIGDNAFEGSALKIADFHKCSFDVLGSGAFKNCKSLTTLVLPSMKELDYNDFIGIPKECVILIPKDCEETIDYANALNGPGEEWKENQVHIYDPAKIKDDLF